MTWKALVAVLVVSSQVSAQALPVVTPEDVKLSPPLQVIPPGEDKIAPLGKGEAAPFGGQLFETNTALRWGLWLQQWEYRYRLDIAQERNLCGARAEYQSTVLKAEKTRAKTVEKDLETRLLRAEQARVTAEHELLSPSFFQSNGFYFAFGVVTAGALVGLGAWALHNN